MLFMAAMLGISLSNNLILLLTFWELTSISSFLLVGYWSNYEAAQRGSRMALTITGMGGLAMLGGFVLLAQITGTYQIDQILMMTEQIQSHAFICTNFIADFIGCIYQKCAISRFTSGYPMPWLHPRLFLPICIRQRWSKQGFSCWRAYCQFLPAQRYITT